MATLTLSQELEDWLHSKTKKTFNSFEHVFAERSFAIFIMLLLSIPALPIPTGGITHVFEIVAMLLAVEMIIGRSSIWLPRRWLKRELGANMREKTIPFLIRCIKWLEKFSRPRMSSLLQSTNFKRLVGLIILAFVLVTFVAPPFSGLDTLPALGVVVICLSLILGDIAIFLIGFIIGCAGLGLVLAFGTVTLNLLHHLL